METLDISPYPNWKRKEVALLLFKSTQRFESFPRSLATMKIAPEDSETWESFSREILYVKHPSVLLYYEETRCTIACHTQFIASLMHHCNQLYNWIRCYIVNQIFRCSMHQETCPVPNGRLTGLVNTAEAFSGKQVRKMTLELGFEAFVYFCHNRYTTK